MAREKKEDIVASPLPSDSTGVTEQEDQKQIFNEMKKDPQLKKFMVPIPDFGAVGCIIAWRTLKELKRLNDSLERK